MALTAAEKMRRRRQKLKDEGKYEEYKEKHRETAKKSRAKKKNEVDRMTSKEREKVRREQRKRSRESVAKARLNRKRKENRSQQSPYKSPCSLGKAIARAKRSLPKSPRKKQVVMKHLIQNIVPSQECNVLKKCSGKDPISNETVQIVKDFFVRDDISRQAPGMKDVVTVRDSDGKHKEQIRHLHNSILETFLLFQRDHPGVKIGKSKFAALRPKHVFLSSKMPHNVCLCRIHENFIGAVEKFKKYCSEFIAYSSNFVESFLCNPPAENCWHTTCKDCRDNLQNSIESCFATSTANTVEWNMWRDVDGKLTKVVEEGSIEDLAECILSLKKEFFTHCYVKREQAKEYHIQKEQVSSKTFDSAIALVQIDFAENYTCVAQDEVQSFHWVQPQVSLFTISSWYEGEQHAAIIVSDDLDHTKRTIVPYLDTILEGLSTGVDLVNIWSDGPSSQFKNRFIAATIPVLQNKFRKKIVWNFFATSHGKGPVDGIGGAMKRQVRNFVVTRKGTVFNAAEFAAAARIMSTEVEIKEMNGQEIEERNKKLNIYEVFEEALPIDSITKMHCIYAHNNIVKGAILSSDMPMLLEERQAESGQDGSIQQGTFLLVQCLGKKQVFRYAAISQGVVEPDEEIKVLFLVKKNSQRTVFMANESDVSYVALKDVIKILPNATMKQNGSRFYYEFNEEIDVNERH